VVSLRTCLYCGGLGPWNREHVLQAAFGTSWVLDEDVCEGCNSGFSPLDSKLVEFVREFVYLGHPDVSPVARLLVGKIGLTRDPGSGAWMSVRVDRTGRPIPFPQLIWLSDSQISFITDFSRWSGVPQPNDGAITELRQICAELADPLRLSLKRSVVPQPDVQPAIVRSARYRYLLRGSTKGVLDQIEAAIRNGSLVASLNGGKPNSSLVSNSREQVRLGFGYEFGSYARAIAKSAINFVCVAVDRDLSRSADLDPLRAFIKTGTGHFQNFVVFRFGQQPPSTEDAAIGFLAKPGCHTVLATGAGGISSVLFFLYSRLFAIVKLSDRSVLAGDRQVAALFDYRTQTHRVFDTYRNAAEFVANFAYLAFE
jgi:hypothetical protein